MLEVVDVLFGERHAAAVLVEHLTMSGVRHEIRRANVYRVEDGRITEIRIFEADQYAMDALIAEEWDEAENPSPS